MKVCVFGAGAVGGHLAVKLARAGHDTCVLARGPHLQAVQAAGGMTLRVGPHSLFGALRASADTRALGPQDVVIVACKATALNGFAAVASPLLAEHTAVVFVQNGIPWWYAQGLSAQRPAPPDLSRLDPGGALARAVPSRHVVGATIYTSNEVVEPGVVVNDSVDANTLIVGETSDRPSDRIRHLRAALEGAGVASPVTHDVRATLWRRLLANMAGSVVCSIIESPIAAHQADPAMGRLFTRISTEGTAIAAAHGVDVAEGTVPGGPPHRFPPGHKPSFLQDLERRRPMEVEAILMAPLAFAQAAGLDVPALQTIAALAAHRASRLGLYAPAG